MNENLNRLYLAFVSPSKEGKTKILHWAHDLQKDLESRELIEPNFVRVIEDDDLLSLSVGFVIKEHALFSFKQGEIRSIQNQFNNIKPDNSFHMIISLGEMSILERVGLLQ